MKTLVITIGVLAVATAVHSLKVERLRKFNDNLAKCSEELGVSPPGLNVEIMNCALIKDGHILNANGEYIKEASLQAIEDAISDAARLEKAQGMFTKCYDEAVQSGATGDEQKMKISTCGLPLVSLFDKL